MLLHTVDRLEGKGLQGIHYKRRSLLCSSTYNGQLLWVTVLDDERQAGILMVAGGRMDGWEERPRTPNSG